MTDPSAPNNGPDLTPYPRPEGRVLPLPHPDSKRNPWGWIWLFALFAILLTASFRNIAQDTRASGDDADRFTSIESQLRLSASLSMGGRGSAEVMKQVRADIRSNRYAARLYAVLQWDNTKELPSDARSALTRWAESDRISRILLQIYGPAKLTPERARVLIAQLPSTPFSLQMAANHARERADLTPVRLGTPMWAIWTLSFGGLGLIALATLAWIGVIVAKFTDHLPIVGLPSNHLPPANADAMAIRAAQILSAFLILSIGLGAVNLGVPGLEGILTVVLMLSFLAALFRLPIHGFDVAGPSIGLTKPTLKDLGAGFTLFLLELPVAVIMAAVGRQIFSFLPAPNHPASNMLLSNPSALVIVAVMLSAVVLAPIWEEIAFRGLMFPALSRITGGVAFPILLTSFLFAAIHPQNPMLWFALGTVGVFGCLGVLYTGRVMPSIIMHAFHNVTILLLTLVISA